MKSSVVPSVFVIICLVCMSITFVIDFILSRIDGNRRVEAVKAEYAHEDQEAAKAHATLIDNLKADCQADKDFILNNMRGGS